MKKIGLAVLALAVLVPLAAQAGPRDDSRAGIARCDQIADDRQWLDCVYGAVQPMRARLSLSPAPDFQQRLVPGGAGPAARPLPQRPVAAAPASQPAPATVEPAPAAPEVTPASDDALQRARARYRQNHPAPEPAAAAEAAPAETPAPQPAPARAGHFLDRAL